MGCGVLPESQATVCPAQRREGGRQPLPHPPRPQQTRPGPPRLSLEGAPRADQQGRDRVCGQLSGAGLVHGHSAGRSLRPEAVQLVYYNTRKGPRLSIAEHCIYM